MHLSKRIRALALAGALSLSLAAPVRAAGYTDLPPPTGPTTP